MAARQKIPYEVEPCPPVELRAPNFSGRRPSGLSKGLSNPWVVIFIEKSPCGKLDSSNRACQMPGGHFRPKKAPAASRRAATGLVKFRVAIFTGKKAPAASWIAATGLVKSWVAIFTGKKAPAVSWIAAAGVVKSLVAIFAEKKPLRE